MIKVIDPSTGSVELLVTGVSTAELTSSRAIAALIGELRSEMTARKTISSRVSVKRRGVEQIDAQT